MLCVISGIAFGSAAVFAKESFASGWSVSTLLATRFVLAAAIFWTVVAIRRPARPSARSAVICIVLGAVGYALQSGFYFAALTKMNAAVVAQLLYIYPAVVFLLALARRKETLAARKLLALASTSLGLVLLLHGGSGSWPIPGVLMALGAAVTYAIYITVASTLPAELDSFLTAAMICSAAGLSLAVFAAASDSISWPNVPIGWLWMLLFTAISTVVAMVTFLAGLRLVGPSAAAILSCIEPVVTALSAALVYSEKLTIWQIAGGVAVLSALVLLQARRRVPAA